MRAAHSLRRCRFEHCRPARVDGRDAGRRRLSRRTRSPTPGSVKQIALTEKQIEASSPPSRRSMRSCRNCPRALTSPIRKSLAQLEGVVKKHGFASYAEYEDVDDNISLVMGGIDPQTKKYVGDEIVLKAQIKEVQADKKMAAERQEGSARAIERRAEIDRAAAVSRQYPARR